MSGDLPLISCLCVTHERHAFVPWVLWCFDRQSHPRRELIIVDSSRDPAPLPLRSDVRRVHVPKLEAVAAKRNVALAEARGSWIAWFDDDDWQHPDRLSWIARAAPGADVVGPTSSYFIHVHEMRAARFEGPRVIFNGAGFRALLARTREFDERLVRASDTPWLRDVLRGSEQTSVLRETSFLWLSHQLNISNPMTKHRFDRSLAEVRAAVTPEAWADTDGRLRSLREQI